MSNANQNAPRDPDALQSLWTMAVGRLAAARIEDPRGEATALLRHAAIEGDDPALWAAALSRFIDQRLAGRSVARITGMATFLGMSFQISEGVYEPCSSSERLIEHVLAWAQPQDRLWRMTDVGTGCGNLLISAAKALPLARGIGVDINEIAVTVAERNAMAHGVSQRVSFVMADAHRLNLPPADMLISTLPWLRTSELGSLRPEVQLYDPPAALDGGRDGLMHLKRLGARLSTWLVADGCAFIQIGYERLRDAIAVFEACGCRSVDILRDAYGIPMGLRVTC